MDDDRQRHAMATQLLEYIANGAKGELGARVWYLRGNGDMSWAIISQTLNAHGSRHPKDGKIWTPSRCKTYFGEPPRRDPTQGV